MQKLGWFKGLEVTQGDQKHCHLIEHMTSYSTVPIVPIVPFSSYSALFIESGEF